jgi:hypothetical protein
MDIYCNWHIVSFRFFFAFGYIEDLGECGEGAKSRKQILISFCYSILLLTVKSQEQKEPGIPFYIELKV